MKRPLAHVTLVYAAGLVAGDRFALPPAILLPVALGVAVLTLLALLLSSSLLQVRPRFGGWFAASMSGGAGYLLWALIFLTGWGNQSRQIVPISPYDVRRLGFQEAELITVRGRLAETPSQRVYVQDEKQSYRFLSTLRLSDLRRDKGDWQRAYGRLLVLTPGTLPREIFAGQEVEVSGVLSKPPGPKAEGLFDYGAYLRRQSIYYQVRTEGAADWKVVPAEREPPFSDRFLAWAQATLAQGLPHQDQPLEMLWAMTLGWKTVDNEIYEPFMQSGTMHIFAISGLHIALIAAIFVALLRVLQVPRCWCGLVVVPLIWFYTAATGWQASAIRATVMMTIIVGGWALSRPTDLLNSLAVAAFAILVWDPQQLFGASFQLSFFVVLSIALLLPPFERARDRWLKAEPLLPRDLVPRWKRASLAAGRWVTTSFAISLASWIGSLPLTAYYFHLFSPVTLVANLVIVPLSSCALAANLGSLVCGAWWGWGAELFNHSAWLWMHLMIQLSKLAAWLPCSWCYLQAPSLLTIALFYAVIIGLLTRWVLAPKRFVPLAGAMVAVAVVYGWIWLNERSGTTLTVLPLGGGFSVHARHAGFGSDMLMDCGRSNEVRFTVKPFLRARGVNRLEALLLTHGDIRHTGGANLVAEEFALRRVYASPVRFRSVAYRQTLNRLEDSPGLLEIVSRGDRVGPWTVLHPEPGDGFSRADDNALVLAATFSGTQVLLVSDLGEQGQAALLERFPGLRADIVITGLPAQGEALSDDFLERLRPQAIVVADSEFPASERANESLRQRLQRAGVEVVYTRLAGTVTVEMKRRRWVMETMAGRPSRTSGQ